MSSEEVSSNQVGDNVNQALSQPKMISNDVVIESVKQEKDDLNSVPSETKSTNQVVEPMSRSNDDNAETPDAASRANKGPGEEAKAMKQEKDDLNPVPPETKTTNPVVEPMSRSDNDNVETPAAAARANKGPGEEAKAVKQDKDDLNPVPSETKTISPVVEPMSRSNNDNVETPAAAARANKGPELRRTSLRGATTSTRGVGEFRNDFTNDEENCCAMCCEICCFCLKELCVGSCKCCMHGLKGLAALIDCVLCIPVTALGCLCCPVITACLICSELD